MALVSQQTGQRGKAREDAPSFFGGLPTLPVAAEGGC